MKKTQGVVDELKKKFPEWDNRSRRGEKYDTMKFTWVMLFVSMIMFFVMASLDTEWGEYLDCWDDPDTDTWQHSQYPGEEECLKKREKFGDLPREEVYDKWNSYQDGVLASGAIFLLSMATLFFRNWRRDRKIYEARERKRKENQIKEATAYFQEGGLTNLQKASDIYTNLSLSTPRKIREEMAKEKERLLDFKGALSIFEELGLHKDAKRIRQKMRDEGKVKVDQTVVHGDYVDDRDTIIKDSVINRSNVGGGSSKMQELEKLTKMKKEGLIDNAEFRQMKKEILGK